MLNPVRHIRGAERLARLQQAREWRERMKPVFDAIYGRQCVTCPTCSGAGIVAEASDETH